MFDLGQDSKVILLWDSSTKDMSAIEGLASELKKITNTNNSVCVENADMLRSSNHTTSSFSDILVNLTAPYNYQPSDLIYVEILRILKPGGKLTIYSNNVSSMLSCLKLSGFTKVVDTDIKTDLKDSNLREVNAFKPDFEVGSSMKLAFAVNKSESNPSAWKLDLSDDVQLDDPDDLLTEEDFMKPDPASLKVCGTTGKRKACKDCSCGLKEELDDEVVTKVEDNKKNFKSSCGSCYLGDAFRCGSCPYIGMPAFKPGEAVKLTNDTLQDVV